MNSFRAQALERDRGRCVICGAPATEVHHIIERRLFTDPGEEGGYFLDNAASPCNPHHIACEQTTISPAQVRDAAGVTSVVLPQHLYDDGIEAGWTLTKWGDLELSNGTRSPSELFWDPSIQRILREGGALERYVLRFRYPRTYHVPSSPGVLDDDRVLGDMSIFEGQRVVVSTKRDGGNTTIYADGYVHARSPESAAHPSESRVRALAAAIAHELPAGWRICGENLQAKHSIHYHHLPAFFLVISVWNERNEALSWDETVDWASLLGLRTVEELFVGPFAQAPLADLWQPTDLTGDGMEGWVIRTADGFPYGAFRRHVAKWVRPAAGAAGVHNWRRARIIENEVEARSGA